jgi:hypothetical protein
MLDQVINGCLEMQLGIGGVWVFDDGLQNVEKLLTRRGQPKRKSYR